MTATKKNRPARSAGLLLHPTSLPGPFGIGDLGPAAYAWVDVLADAKQRWWQVLPLGPPGHGDSPYQSFSAFAGNPYLVSPEALVQEGLLRHEDFPGGHFPADRVDYGRVIPFKEALLTCAWDHFRNGAASWMRPLYDEFCVQHRPWLHDYALFMALKESLDGPSWTSWPTPLVLREPAALQQAEQELANAIGRHQLGQFLFYRQWKSLKEYAHHRGVMLIGDLAIFVSGDSADVWANPDLFLLDQRRQPTVVAGVPPDYFSADGQLWGNPLYNWDRLKQTGYAWWVARCRALLEQVDLIRLDHFRGFEAYWEIPAGSATARTGRWMLGPGADFLQSLRQALGSLPVIAEDLGLITPEVAALREQFELPGMRVLHFAFSGPDNPYLPHNYLPNTVVYTGTHDNDTTVGWYSTLPQHESDFLRRYLVRSGDGIAWDLVRMAWSSVADYAIAPLQDILGLGTEARMNLPGRASGNWGWRLAQGLPTRDVIHRLADLTWLHDR